MAWNLAAFGGDIAEAAEHALLAELRAVLAKRGYGTQGSSLHGEFAHADPVHDTPAESAPTPDVPVAE